MDANEPTAAPPALVVRPPRSPLALTLSCVAAVAGLSLTGAATSTQRLVGGAAAVVFGLIALLVARRWRAAPALTADQAGITDTASRTAAGFVPWSDVTGIVARRTQGRRYLTVLVADPGAVLERVDASTRAAMVANLAVLGSPVNIPLRGLALGLPRLTLELARYSPLALPAALHARSAGTAPAGADDAAIAELRARADAAGVTVPADHLRLLREIDGFRCRGLQIFASRPCPSPSGSSAARSDGTGVAEGVVEATLAQRCQSHPDTGTALGADYTLLAQDVTHRYALHSPTGEFRVLDQSDQQPVLHLSSFSQLIVTALEKFDRPIV